MYLIRVYFSLISLSLLVACASLPTPNKVKAFGDAAASSSSAFRAALSANNTIVIEHSKRKEADAYINGEPYQLILSEAEKKFVLSAPDQLAALKALNNYATALSKAADDGVIAELETASADLGAAVGAIGVTVVPTAAPVIGPAFKLSGRLIGIGLGNAYASEVQAILVSTDPFIQELSRTLPVSLRASATFVNAQVENFEIQQQILLDSIRSDKKIDRIQLYREYLMARRELETIQAQVAALKNSNETFKQMAEAHEALAKGSPNTEALIKQFSNTADSFSELLNALQ